MSGSEMLEDTLTNVNELIETANATIQNTLGGVGTGDSKNKQAVYLAKAKCITKGAPSCDKDEFDAAFSDYVQSFNTCNGNNKCTIGDVQRLFAEIYTKEAAKALESALAKINDMKAQITDLLTVANEQTRYYNHLSDLEGKYSEARQAITADVDKQTALLKTSNRKQHYEQEQNTMVQYVMQFVRIFYWVAVIAWVVVLFLRGKTTPVNGGLTLLFVAFPFVSDILIVWAFKIVSAVYSSLPTDAYLDMS